VEYLGIGEYFVVFVGPAIAPILVLCWFLAKDGSNP